MNTEQTPQETLANPAEKPTLGQLWQDIKKYKKLYYKVLGITFIVSALITLSIPNYYVCTVKLAPELSSSSSNKSTLASLASSFGIKLGGASSGSEALFPTLYPDLMNSVAFRTSLFPVTVQMEDNISESVITYYDYLKDWQKRPWWSTALNATNSAIADILTSLFYHKQEKSEDVNPFKLTKEQYDIVKQMEKKVVCDVDKKTLVISIDVIDTDPLVAAIMADSVQEHLQNFITDYRTKKARIDLDYNQKLFREAQVQYEQARKRSAVYNDANQHVFLDRVRSEQIKLENEMNLQFQAYSQVAAQLRLAEAKVQEDTPAFTLLQPATVPVKKAGPKRSVLCLTYIFLVFVVTSIYVFHHEGHLIPLFHSSKNENDYDEDDIVRALIKLSTTVPQEQSQESKR